jgi:uncharacterized protein
MSLPAWPHAESPFHPGELEAHRRVGLRDMEDIGRRIVRAEMPDQHRTFFQSLPWLVVGAADSSGRLWATLLTGPPGFVASPVPNELSISALPAPEDPLSAAVAPGRSVGLLGIELSTRRRNRANGIVQQRSRSGFNVLVEQSFGNCPKYIQKREVSLAVANSGDPVTSHGLAAPVLDATMRGMLREADTFFLASTAPGTAHNRGCDVSHRGGRPGFVAVSDDGKTITWPDFEGNYLFNTLGNLLVEPRTGIVVVDFRTGDMLHVTGRAEIIWDGPLVDAFDGAQRLVRVTVEEALLRPRAVALRGELLQFSPTLTGTGVW